MPGWTLTQRSGMLSSRTRFMYFERSMTTASPTACPASDVPPPRGRTGDSRLRGQPDGLLHVVAVFGDHHTERLDLVDAGVGGVEEPGEVIEADLALDRLRELTR